MNVSHSESGFEDDFSVFSASSSTWDSVAAPQVDPFTTVYDAPIKSGSGAANTPYNVGSSSFYDQGAIRNVPKTNTSAFDDPLCNGKSLLPPPTMLSMPTIIKPEIKAKPKIQTKLMSTTKVSRDYSALQSISTSAAITPAPSSVAAYSAPMVGLDDPVEYSYAIVLYNFDALQDGDLSLRVS